MILTEFIFESVCLCTIGGLIGLVFSYAIAALINATIMPASLSLPIVFVGILVSFVVGIVSGLLPAMRAAKLDPVVALSYE
ncbi:MAG: hypothetical protein DRP08_04685 [Candidatus Aenigmatarchaeota archaeon]|nr:MAG: hypothetical protein DRP08_04685 [Candidatus Aenigmarchaeota archaeon]